MTMFPEILFYGILAVFILTIVAITVAAWREYRKDRADKHHDKE